MFLNEILGKDLGLKKILSKFGIRKMLIANLFSKLRHPSALVLLIYMLRFRERICNVSHPLSKKLNILLNMGKLWCRMVGFIDQEVTQKCVLLPYQTPKRFLDMTCAIYYGIFSRHALDILLYHSYQIFENFEFLMIIEKYI